MDCRVRLQLAEALGPLNRWYCSQSCGCEVTDAEALVIYYIRSGGAADFANRYDEAIGCVNRWYCSEFYRRDVRDPEILWHYYMTHAPLHPAARDPRYRPNSDPPDLSFAS